MAHSNGFIKSQKMPKFGFWPKWRPKLLPVTVFISDSHSTPSTLSKTSIMSSRRTLFEIFGAKVRIFKKYLNELQEFPTCNFLIFCGHYGPLSLCLILSIFGILEKRHVSFKVFGLSFFRPHFLTKFSETNFDGQYLWKCKT